MGLVNLPDFVSKKIDMLEAARMFKKAIDKNCRRMGMDPDWETNIMLYKDYNSDSKSDKIIVETGYNSTTASDHSSGLSIYSYKAVFKQLSPTSVQSGLLIGLIPKFLSLFIFSIKCSSLEVTIPPSKVGKAFVV